MGNWLDRWARRAATSPEQAADRDVASSNPDSRRTFLKRAAIVGGTAWSVPVIQSALAPAYAASNGPGGSCTDGNTCLAGYNCSPVTGTCGGAGAVCGTSGCYNSNCATNGYCGGTGAACDDDTQCAHPGNACRKDGTCKHYP